MREKSNTLQIMRAIAIIMVVLQHSIGRVASTNIELKSMYMLNHIDVSVFFIISGYLYEIKKDKYKQEGFVKFLSQKFNALMIPYLFWSLVIPIGLKFMNIVLSGKLESKVWSWGEIIINTITYKEYYVQHLWFIYILFAFFLIHYLSGDLFIKLPIFMLIFIGLNFVDGCDIPFLIGKFVLHFTTFSIGRLIAHRGMEKLRTNKGLFIVVLFTFCGCYCSELWIPDSFTYKLYGHLLYALSGSAVVYYIASIISNLKGKLCYSLQVIGADSFEIYILHNPYISVSISMILLKCGLGNGCIIFVTTVLAIIVPIIAVEYIREFMPIGMKLFGRKG